MKLLIVDDSLFSQQFVKKEIVKLNIPLDLLFASSGEEGLSVYIKEKPDCIITDLLMPGIGGQAMIQKIRETDSECRIIVLSSDIQKAVRDEVEQLGISAFINKPINSEKLLMIADIIGGD